MYLLLAAVSHYQTLFIILMNLTHKFSAQLRASGHKERGSFNIIKSGRPLKFINTHTHFLLIQHIMIRASLLYLFI